MKSGSIFSLAGALVVCASALCAPPRDVFSSPRTPPQADKPDPSTRAIRNRLTIEISGGDKNVPVENASVYVKYIQEHAIKKDRKVELNVKTNDRGVAHVPDPPLGRALIQVIADGWKTYGRWYDITDTNQVIKIHLDRPPKWY